MKIIPISSKLNQPKNFKGTMVKNAGYHDVVAAKETGKRMEKGQAVFPKNKIYYADPLEFIDDKLNQLLVLIYHR